MNLQAYRTNRISLIWFISLLALFLIVADSLMLLQFRNTILEETKSHTDIEGQLLAQHLMESILKNDYATVENFVHQWGRKHKDIGNLRITLPNGFVLADFEREPHGNRYYAFHKKQTYLDRTLFDLEMTEDIGSVSKRIQTDGFRLILISLLFISGLGILLWRILKKTAIEPLQQEIMEHKKTEQALQKSSHELQMYTQELESYSYSIAHDLRAPVRAIISFSQILKSDANEKLDKNEHQVLDRVISAGKYMAELIDDILSLSRITRDDIHEEPVELGELAQHTIDRLREREPQRNVVFSVESGLRVRGDARHLQILIENLFSNAWKYTSPREPAQIELGSRQDKGQTVYFVRDNGVGFDMNYVDKIFLPFQRLHGKKEFEGTGIGLAIARRIIDRHLGKIWIESELDKGTTVFFTLGSADGTRV